MIVYEPNKYWLRDLANLMRSYTIRKILYSVLWIGLFTTVVCVMCLWVLKVEVEFHSGVFSLLGIVLSILLVFKTNSAYDRWWEGRKQWGALVNHCRNLAINLHTVLPADQKETRFYLAKSIANFCIALKEHLRKGVRSEELVSVTNEELEQYKASGHIPNTIANEIMNKIMAEYRDKHIDQTELLNIKPHAAALVDILGACERIRKTPIPFSYNVYIKLFVTIYGLMLPFGFISEFGYFTIPLVMLIFFAMIGVEMMGEEIEDPFGLDCNDLPTATIAHTIKNNVYEIFEVGKLHNITHEASLYEKIH